MKFMKKLAGVLAATVLSVGMLAGTAFAEGTTQVMGADTKVVVNVTGVESSDTVTAYKIATVTLDASNQLVVDMATGLPADYDTIAEIAAVTGDTNKLAMANAIAQKIPATSAAVASTTDGSLELAPGYYLLRTTTTSGKTKVYQFNIVSVWPTIDGGKYVLPTSKTVGIKSVNAPSVTKTINGAASIDDVADGKQVTMVITTAIPSYPKDATNATYKLTDTATRLSGLTDFTVAIKGASTTLTEGTDYELGSVDASFGLTFTKAFIEANPGAEIVITYKTTLAIGDYLDGTAKNEVYGTFNPSPYNAATADTDKATVTAKTYGFYFKKLGANADETPLAGTIFEVKQGSTLVATLKADASGYIQLDGLANGTYTLHEVSVGVAGFGTIGDFNITLDSTTCTANNPITTNQTETNYLAVAAGTDAAGENAAAGEVFDPVAEVPTLPETGGIGTIVFSVLGVLIMAAAVVLFVRRKQSEK